MSDLEKFFVNIIPGMESVVHLELCERWTGAPNFFPQVQYYKGGLEFEAPFDQGCALNKVLRSSNRILYRWMSFEAPNIKTFVKTLSQASWGDYFPPGTEVDIQFSSRSSKLSNGKQIQRELAPLLKKHKLKIGKKGMKLFVRLFRDQAQLSIDTTGERGQFRGADKKVGGAPLRDNVASGLLRLLFQGTEGRNITLIDPMMGSGTFLVEALELNKPLERDFAFQKFPRVSPVDIVPEGGPQVSRVIGFDRDSKMVKLVEDNLSSYDPSLYEVAQRDLFKDGDPVAVEGDPFVIVNPPWGKRLKGIDFDQMVEAIRQKFNPQRLGVLVPAYVKIKNDSLEKVRDVYMEVSGTKCRFLVLAPFSLSTADTGR